MTDQAPGTRSLASSIELDATPEQVWEMIATGQGLSRWFPVEARVSPGVGGEIWFSWGKGVMEGTAKIVTWEPPHRLVSEWGGMHDEYTIESKDGTTTLTIVSNGFGEGGDWDDMYDSVRTGWMFELGGLRHALDHHAGQLRDVVRAVRRCAPDRDAIASMVLDDALAPGVDLGSARVGDEIELELDGLGRVPARVVVANQPRDMALVTQTLNNAYWRVLLEAPCGGSPEPALDVTLWASTYGLDTESRQRLGRAIDATLDRLLGSAGSLVAVSPS